MTLVYTVRSHYSLNGSIKHINVIFKEVKLSNIALIIADEEKPMLSCPPNTTSNTDLGQRTAAVEWDLPKATDNSREAMAVSCFPQRGSNFTTGQKEVVCKAVDSSGNNSTCRFMVIIIGRYKGQNILLVVGR